MSRSRYTEEQSYGWRKLDPPAPRLHAPADARVLALLTRQCWGYADKAAAPGTRATLTASQNCAFDRAHRLPLHSLRASRQYEVRRSIAATLHERSALAVRREIVLRFAAQPRTGVARIPQCSGQTSSSGWKTRPSKDNKQ